MSRLAAHRRTLTLIALACTALGGCTLFNPYDLVDAGDFRMVAVGTRAAPEGFLNCVQLRMERLQYPQVVAAGFSREIPAVRLLKLREGWELRSMSGTASYLARVTQSNTGFDLAVFSNTTPGNPRYADAIEAAAHACADVPPVAAVTQAVKP